MRHTRGAWARSRAAATAQMPTRPLFSMAKALRGLGASGKVWGEAARCFSSATWRGDSTAHRGLLRGERPQRALGRPQCRSRLGGRAAAGARRIAASPGADAEGVGSRRLHPALQARRVRRAGEASRPPRPRTSVAAGIEQDLGTRRQSTSNSLASTGSLARDQSRRRARAMSSF
jgi:hypothetical protein